MVGRMTTLVVDSLALADDDIEHLDFEPLTAVYVAPQSCGGRGAACLFNSNCCSGLHCSGAVPVHFIFGTCV